MKKIVVVEDLDLNDSQKARLASIGEVVYFDSKEPDADKWLLRTQGADVICAGVQGFIDAYQNLSDVFVTVPYIGLDFIDKEIARNKNVQISNSPGCNKNAVTELAMGMLIYIARRLDVVVNAEAGASRDHAQIIDLPTIGLYGKKVTILGQGNIGAAIGVACSALGMEVIFFKRGDAIAFSLNGANIVFNALDANESTQAIVTADAINSCADGALYISVARNETEDIPALLKALDSGKLAFMAHDSGSTRSGLTDAPKYLELLQHPKVYVTPHIGFNTDQSVGSCGDAMIDNIEAWLKEEQQNTIV